MLELEPDDTTQMLPVARADDPQTAPMPVVVDSADRRRRVVRGVAVGAFVALGACALMVVWGLLSGSQAAPAAQSTQPASAGNLNASVGSGTPSASRGASAISIPTASSVAPVTSVTSAQASASATASASASPSASATGRKPGKPSKSANPGH